MTVPSKLYRPSLALLTDFYELTMLSGYWQTGRFDTHACFEYTFRVSTAQEEPG